MTLADQIRALKADYDGRGSPWNAALDRAAELADAQAGQLSNDERLEYQMALIWCSAAADFAPEGQAREGWLKLGKPLIDRQPIEGASRDNWCAWLDDLPLPDGFSEGITSLQEFIHGLPQAGFVAAAYEDAAGATEARITQCEDGNGGQCRLRSCAMPAIIRDRTPADARAALDRLIREAEARGMEMALEKVEDNFPGTIYLSNRTKTRNAILAAAAKHREAGNG
jgi:hypothetical protein